MAAKDPVLEELMRSARATSPSRSNGALAPKLEANSTLSLDGVNHEDIGKSDNMTIAMYPQASS